MRLNGFWNTAWLATVVFGTSSAFGTDYLFNNSSGDVDVIGLVSTESMFKVTDNSDAQNTANNTSANSTIK